ncbi:hypothetical protein [Streptomyces sp. NBC_00162]|uniref:hypothetical protein n=1 Tax=Streptomyces sp. NBC_00162 TaxID=2903629 RepID=UPI00214C4B1A|nr:hypothetical protein [Streptomyces sp. NBC_00162]UUU44366.1 hypothetical protein JIW86_39920 [Streptomyces sp. NBC_00162]
MLLGMFGEYVYELATAESLLKNQQDVEDQLDQEEPPFTAVVSPDLSALDEDAWTMVLDRTLNPAEAQALLALDTETDHLGRRVWALLGPLGGRILGGYPGLTMAEGFPHGQATSFTLNLFSQRKSPVSVTGMQAVDVHCAPSTAQTVVEKPTAGETGYSGILFDLDGRDSAPVVPVITDGGPDQGRPYFEHRKIDLGGGLEPGGLRVAAAVASGACGWDIEATYTDADGRHTGVVLRDGTKQFRAESGPVAPRQRFVYSLESPTSILLPCHEKRYASNITCRP